MTRCDNEGATHHTGCECHEARRDAEIERLRAVVRQVHELVARVQIDWDSGLNRLICNIRDITKGKEKP